MPDRRAAGAAPIRASSTTRRSTLAHARVGADQRLEPVQRVHARRRLGLQPGLAEPDEVPQRGRDVRHRGLQARRRRRLPRPGDRRRAVELPDREDRPQRPRVPPDRARVRQPRRLPDGRRGALRLRRGAQRGGGDHGADDRTGVSQVRRDRGLDRRLRRVREEPRAAQPGDADAPRCRLRDRCSLGRGRAARRPRARPGTRRSSSARSTAIATRRRRCSPPPARSAS